MAKTRLLYPRWSTQDRHDVDSVVLERKPRRVAAAGLLRAGEREYARCAPPTYQAAVRTRDAKAAAGLGD